jgi:hypothetical protein
MKIKSNTIATERGIYFLTVDTDNTSLSLTNADHREARGRHLDDIAWQSLGIGEKVVAFVFRPNGEELTK